MATPNPPMMETPTTISSGQYSRNAAGGVKPFTALAPMVAVAQQFCSAWGMDNGSDIVVAPGHIFAQAFDDVYFLPGQGLAESRFVFLEGCGLPGGWQGKDAYTIGELGFGTGLNFLSTWQAYDADSARSERLTYISIEGFPLQRAQIAAVHEAWPELAPYTAQLLAQYPQAPHPELVEGCGQTNNYFPFILRQAQDEENNHPVFHLNITENIKLILIFADVAAAFAQWPSIAVNAWFLDGFKPSQNPDMWSENTMHQLAARSLPGTKLATFTAAGMVKRALQAAGFTIIKTPGFQHKRERITAIYELPQSSS